MYLDDQTCFFNSEITYLLKKKLFFLLILSKTVDCTCIKLNIIQIILIYRRWAGILQKLI